MASKAKSRTYGKKKSKDVVAALESLSLTPSPLKKVTNNKQCQPRPVLVPIAQNEVARSVDTYSIDNGTSHNISIEDDQSVRCIGTSPKLGPTTVGHDNTENEQLIGSIEAPELLQTMPGNRKETVRPRSQRSEERKLPEPRSTRIVSNHERPVSVVSISKSDLLSLPSELSGLLSLPYIHPTLENFTTQHNFWTRSLTIRKIAEGSYASIFRLSVTSQPELYTVWKLMPLKSKTGRGSRQVGATFIDDAIAELKLLEAMSKSPGFVEFRSARVLRGIMPDGLRAAHDEWESELKESEKENLGERTEYGQEQLWLFVEMTDAGTDLETILKGGLEGATTLGMKACQGCIDVFEAWDIFWGVAEALAHGEQHSHFEHRDLHPGNVCIKRRSQNPDDSFNDGIQPLIKRFTTLEVTLIDYTLSRATIEHNEDESTEDTEVETLANSMRDKGLFQQNSEVELDQMQYDTYRHMRDIMHSHHRGRRKQQGWRSYMPMTNVLWLYHLLTVLLKKTAILNAQWEVDEVTLDKCQAMTAFRLNDLRRVMDPEKMRKWEYRSATELISQQMRTFEKGVLCKVME